MRQSPHHHDAHPHHHHEAHAVAGRPTFSLLRLSAWERLSGCAILLGALWLLVFQVVT